MVWFSYKIIHYEALDENRRSGPAVSKTAYANLNRITQKQQ